MVPVGPASWANALSVGTAVFTLDSTDIRASGGNTLSDVLVARVPGLSVLRSGGSAAEGSRVQLRGPRSFLMSTQPIVVVDGIRVDATQEASIIDVGVRVSRLDDIAPEDIARVDVLPGAAAASLFGPGAAGGALLITTKPGHAGPLRWDARAESRMGRTPDDFPANYRMTGVIPTNGQPTTNCDRLSVAAGFCTPTRLDVWNPLEENHPFRLARTSMGSLGISGGDQQTSGRVGVSGGRTLGVTPDDDAGRLGVRANVTRHVGDAIDLGVHGGYTHTSAGLPQRGNGGGVIAAGLFGSATDDGTHGYRGATTPDGVRQRATHWTAGASAVWRVKPWLTATALYGRDDLDQTEDFHTLLVFGGGSLFLTDHSELTHAMTTVSTSLAAEYPIARPFRIAAKTLVGYDRLGSLSIAHDSQTFLERRLEHDWKLGGPWLRQQLVLRDRLFLNGSVRWERRTAFGEHAPDNWFKSVDAAWLLADVGMLHAPRLRAAYGEAGNWIAGNPGLLGTAPSPLDVSTGELTERSAETEVGADARVGSRLSLAFTAFRANASRLYVVGATPPSTGSPGTTAAVPAGAMRNEGIEVVASARLVERERLRWDATLIGATLRNRVVSLGNFPPVIGTDTRIVIGSPLGGFWARPYSYVDANGDGIIAVSELHFGDTAVFAGSSVPTREASLHTVLSLPGGIRAAALLDYRGGQKLSNTNELVRCRSFLNCRPAQDPASSLEDQAKYAVTRSPGSSDPFVQDASFLKLRDLSVAWSVPERWARAVGGGATITVAGRNLVTWTQYDGLDPELTTRRFDQYPRQELAKSPLVRELLVRVDFRTGAN